MHYRLTLDKKRKDSILIEDVIRFDERLIDDQTSKIGDNVKMRMTFDEFFGKLRESIIKCNTIMTFRKQQSKYYITWFEGGDKKILHHDTFELEGNDPIFDKKMELCGLLYTFFGAKSQKKVTKMLISNGAINVNDPKILSMCTEFIRTFSKWSRLFGTDLKTATEVYKYIKDHTGEFDYFDFPLDAKVNKQLKGVRQRYIATIVGVSILALPIVPLHTLLCVIVLFRMYLSEIDRIKFKEHYKVLNDLLVKLEGVIDKEYLEKLAEKDENEPVIGLVDIIEKELENIKGHVDANIVEDLIRLEIDYSNRKIREYSGENIKVDKFQFLIEFLTITSKGYAHSDQDEIFFKRQSDISLQLFYDALEYLGYKKEAVLKNTYLREVISSIKGLIENPYTGVEVDIIKMILLAVDYVQTYGIGEQESATSDFIRASFDSELEAAFKMASLKYHKASRLEQISSTDITQFLQAIAEANAPARIIEMKPLK